MTATHLSHQHALALFYHTALGLALVTVVVVGVVLWRRRGVLPPAHHPSDRFQQARRMLMQGLGGLWLLDGLLQAQPAMVTRFVAGLVGPLAAGQPAPLAAVMQFGARLWSISPPLFNVMATFVQIAIGMGLLIGRTRWGQRTALMVSLIWGLLAWVLGEGAGGIFSGGGWLTGSPGSVLLYMGAALLLLRPESWWRSDRAGHWFRGGLVGVFLVDSLVQMLPSFGWWSPALPDYVRSMAEMPQPAFFSAPLRLVVHLVAYNPSIGNGVMILGILLCVATFAFWPRNRGLLWYAVGWTFLGWWIGQDFGVLGGMGTDPNLGAILILGIVTWGVREGAIGFFPADSIRDSRGHETAPR